MSKGSRKHRCRHSALLRISVRDVIGTAVGSLVSHEAEKALDQTQPSALDSMLAHPMASHIWVVVFVVVVAVAKVLPRVPLRNATSNFRVAFT
jgi:hypothetical protein